MLRYFPLLFNFFSSFFLLLKDVHSLFILDYLPMLFARSQQPEQKMVMKKRSIHRKENVWREKAKKVNEREWKHSQRDDRAQRFTTVSFRSVRFSSVKIRYVEIHARTHNIFYFLWMVSKNLFVFHFTIFILYILFAVDALDFRSLLVLCVVSCCFFLHHLMLLVHVRRVYNGSGGNLVIVNTLWVLLNINDSVPSSKNIVRVNWLEPSTKLWNFRITVTRECLHQVWKNSHRHPLKCTIAYKTRREQLLRRIETQMPNTMPEQTFTVNSKSARLNVVSYIPNAWALKHMSWIFSRTELSIQMKLHLPSLG